MEILTCSFSINFDDSKNNNKETIDYIKAI